MLESVKHIPLRNQLLTSLPREEYARLQPHFEYVGIKGGKIIYNIGDRIQHVYFINEGMVSLLSMDQNGATVEVGLVGHEGAVGSSIILKNNITPCEIVVQIPLNNAVRIKTNVVLDEFDRGGVFQTLLLRYTHAMLKQISLSAVCNRFHSAEQRLSRGLLIAHDRMKSNTINLTQEIVALMLGCPRTGVTLTAGNLQKQGLIRYSRGRITILNRRGLEMVSCDCYKAMKNEFENLYSL